MNLQDLAIDTLRDAAGKEPDAFLVRCDGSVHPTKVVAEQRLRTLCTNHYDQQAQTRATYGTHP